MALGWRHWPAGDQQPRPEEHAPPDRVAHRVAGSAAFATAEGSRHAGPQHPLRQAGSPGHEIAVGLGEVPRDGLLSRRFPRDRDVDVAVDQSGQRRRVGEVEQFSVGRGWHGRVRPRRFDAVAADEDRGVHEGRRSGPVDHPSNPHARRATSHSCSSMTAPGGPGGCGGRVSPGSRR